MEKNNVIKKNLTLQEQEYVLKYVKHNSKSTLGGYILTLFLWPIGINRAYLGQKKEGVIRIILSILNTLTAIAIAGVAVNQNTSSLTDALVYNTVLTMSFVGLSMASVSMLIFELFSIPRWILNIDNANKSKAEKEVIQARYVSEHLLKEQISDDLLKNLKSDIETELNKYMEELVNNLRAEMVQGKSQLPKAEKVFNEIAEETQIENEKIIDEAEEKEAVVKKDEEYEKNVDKLEENTKKSLTKNQSNKKRNKGKKKAKKI